ncbi:hypothetical protein BCR43DRAFT_34075 [Syncephalastrum racemosum]|uniref:Uncharacterized protein n=1 Tax=Syncephalastrum racemosum TaxID=13706 RepID=A0A1X2HU65_SYNRA|nr:hypothetical protein BCR43DRAFT_34075 [Syncephalastrum racemosum]
MQEKSASSVSPASSASCSTPSLSWNSSQAPTTVHNHLLTRLIRPHETRSASTTRCKLPPNAIAHPASADYPRYLSSSVPLDGIHYRTHRRTSAPSSPRSSNSSSLSRQSSIAESRTGSATKHSIRHMFSAFLPQQSHLHDDSRSTRSFEVEMLDPSEGRIEWRWIGDKEHHARLARVLLVPIAGGLCATVICNEEQGMTHAPEVSWTTLVRNLGSALEDQLRDFVAFLLTKEETHFSILSFVSSYPGLIHFIHVERGIVIAPQLVHLSSEHLYDMSDKYDLASLDHLSWPSVEKLTDLCQDMLRHAPGQPELEFYLHRDTHFQYAYYYSEPSDACLLAIYFGFVPEHQIETLHRRLFHDVSQRVLA